MSEKLIQSIAKQLKDRRKELKKTQKEMAEIIGIDINTILGIEKCRKERFSNIMKYAEGMGSKDMTIKFSKLDTKDEEVTNIVKDMMAVEQNYTVAKLIKVCYPTLLKRLRTGKWTQKEIDYILENFKK